MRFGLRNISLRICTNFLIVEEQKTGSEEEEKTAVCDVMAKGDHFFHVFTSISAGAYYSDPRCWKALGYVGNVPSGGAFTGPPKEVLDQLGLKQTVE